MVSFKSQNLSFMEKATPILKGVDFSFESGQIICFLGSNGAGKSTLLKICAGVIRPSCGSILLNNQDIFKLKDEERSKLISWLPQNLTRPYQMSVREFMQLNSLPLNTATERNLSATKDCPLAFFELVQLQNKNISTLSGGEWKRTQLARVWRTGASVVLLDEPDSDLDLRHKQKLSNFCKDYVQQNNAIMMIVTHDIVFAREVADTVCAMADGYLVWNSKKHEFWNTKIINKIFSTKVF